jgi:hypothetical protein
LLKRYEKNLEHQIDSQSRIHSEMEKLDFKVKSRKEEVIKETASHSESMSKFKLADEKMNSLEVKVTFPAKTSTQLYTGF